MTPHCTAQGNQAQGMEIILVLVLGLYTDMRTSILGLTYPGLSRSQAHLSANSSWAGSGCAFGISTPTPGDHRRECTAMPTILNWAI